MSNTNITNSPLIGKNSNGPVSLTTVSSPHSTFNESYFISNSTITGNDTAIKGQLVTVSLVVSNAKIESAILNLDDYKKTIKFELCRRMAEEMYKRELFSFTVADDIPMDSKTFFARMFVTPNDQTQIIRQMLANK